ncbi:MAG: CCA tRNA nucleotidyltransferase [Ruminococcaceae bacterium]|nr:CCA tRNA nucleotidyltransferase [Oscillospiraceae bacterium]
MQILLPQEVIDIINTLQQLGYNTYVVGGCVRDVLRGKAPEDWDIATAATPEAVMAAFPKSIPTGIRHGTVTVVMPGGQYEVTTFRVDGVYENHRSPESITFTAEITEDLSRRDFTMNAMAYHPETGLIDPFGGEEDIRRGLIRCVGDPLVRFNEDALRMMRAVRFCAQTGFALREDIPAAMQKLSGLMRSISGERIRDELLKILLSDRPEAVLHLHETGVLAVILPELDRCFFVPQHIKYHVFDVGRHSIEVTRHVPKTQVLRLAALLHDIGKPDKKTTDEDGIDHFKGHDKVSAQLAEAILTRLRLDNRTKDAVVRLITCHDRRIEATKKSVRRAAVAVGPELFTDLLALQRADNCGQNPAFLEERLAHNRLLESLWQEIRADDDALSLSDLAIGGHDLLALGYQGKAIGSLLSAALAHVLEHPEDNQRSSLLEWIQKDIRE